MLVLWSTSALPDTGLEFLEPQDIAFVEVRGVVRNDATGVPVAGAKVLAIWEGTTYGFHGSFRHCLRVDAATSDATGTFSLVAPSTTVYRKGMAQQYVDVRIHARGMQESLPPGSVDRPYNAVRRAQSGLGKFVGPKEYVLQVEPRVHPTPEDVPDRLVALQRAARQPFKCETTGDRQQVQGFYEALASEALGIARSKYEVAVAKALESDAQLVFDGYEARSRAHDKIMQPVLTMPDPNDLEARDSLGKTPLMNAASSGNAEAVQSMLHAGANPNRTIEVNDLVGGDSALGFAIYCYRYCPKSERRPAPDYPATLQALLGDPRTKVDLRSSPVRLTPLMRALYALEDDLVAILLAAGADPNATANAGEHTVVGVALKALNTRPIAPAAERQLKLLLADRRLDLNLPMGREGTPLTYALAMGDAARARQILEAGANPNALDTMKRSGLTASVSASILNPQHPQFLEGVRLMASWPGVDFAVALDGATSIQMARKAGREDLVQILETAPEKRR